MNMYGNAMVRQCVCVCAYAAIYAIINANYDEWRFCNLHRFFDNHFAYS